MKINNIYKTNKNPDTTLIPKKDTININDNFLDLKKKITFKENENQFYSFFENLNKKKSVNQIFSPKQTHESEDLLEIEINEKEKNFIKNTLEIRKKKMIKSHSHVFEKISNSPIKTKFKFTDVYKLKAIQSVFQDSRIISVEQNKKETLRLPVISNIFLSDKKKKKNNESIETRIIQMNKERNKLLENMLSSKKKNKLNKENFNN